MATGYYVVFIGVRPLLALVLISHYYHSMTPTHHDVRVLYLHSSARPWRLVARTEKVLHHTSCHSAEDLEPPNFGDR